MNSNTGTTNLPGSPATPSTVNPNAPRVGEHLGEARDHLRQAGRGAIDTLSSAADQAREQYQGHREEIRGELRHAGSSLQAAAGEAGMAAREKVEHAMAYSREVGERSTAWVRDNPMKALGLAVLGGIVLSRLLSRSH